MDNKKWIRAIITGGILGTAFAWINGLSQTNGLDITPSYADSNVPAPGPSQKKVVLKKLGMA